MRSLQLYAKDFGVEYVSMPEDADVIITNDVFPSCILGLGKKLVKRMDGIYWDFPSLGRNESLNRAATQADLVIFISRYSQESFQTLYGGHRLKAQAVVLNQVDDRIFNQDIPAQRQGDKFVWTASASNWARPEKRFSGILQLAEVIDDDSIIQLIGHCDCAVPANVVKLGYKSDEYEVARILRNSNAFFNPSYRDAVPKVVCQAVACGLPVLFANSGGTHEAVVAGLGIRDRKDIVLEEKTPDLNIDDMDYALAKFRWKYFKSLDEAEMHRPDFKGMLYSYFKNCRSLL
jgi:glycosyltransferase involved in cell wall biosynthesis